LLRLVFIRPLNNPCHLRLKKLRRWRGKHAPGFCYSRHP